MSESIFRGGLPYAPDVNRLIEAFPVAQLAEGRLIKHGDIEVVIQSTRGSGRYYGVVNSWIGKMIAEHGIVIVWSVTEGVSVLDPTCTLNHAESRFRQKAKQIIKAVKRFAWVDRSRLNEQGQARLDHESRLARKLCEAADQALRDSAVELAPVVSLPKRKLIS